MNDEQQTQERPFGGFGDTSSYDGALEDGKYYDATLLGIKERLIEKGQWPGWKVVWGFDVEHPQERIEAMTSTATGPDSTAGDWLVALLGKERYDRRGEQRIAPDEMAAKPCMILIRFKDSGWPKVAGVFPRQNAPQAPVAAPPASQAPQVAPPPPVAPPAHQASEFDDLPF